MHRMRSSLARMTVRALRVADALMAERGVGGAPAEPVLHLGLQLLARRTGRFLVTIGALERGMPGIGGPLAWKRAACGTTSAASAAIASAAPSA